MFILAIGPLARATVGPVERLLNMVGEQRACAFVYASAFAANIALCVALIPQFGVAGAAIAISGAMILEAPLLYAVANGGSGCMSSSGGRRAAPRNDAGGRRAVALPRERAERRRAARRGPHRMEISQRAR